MLLGFTRALRAAGVPVTQDRAHGFLDRRRRRSASTTGRRPTGPAARPCAARPTTWPRYDQVFAAWFDPRDGAAARPDRARPRARRPPTCCPTPRARAAGGDGRGGRAAGRRLGRPRCSATATSRRSTPPRSGGWTRCSPGCRCARRLVVRHGTGGGTAASSTPRARCAPRCARWASRPRSRGAAAASRPRRVVLLVDVSGSMSAYADALLRLAHRLTQCGRAAGGTVETFTRRHPADPRHPGAALARRRPRPRGRRRGRARLVGRHPAGGDAAGLPRPAGASAGWPAAPSWWSSATGGSAATPTLLGEQMAPPASGSRTASSGSTRTAARRATSPLQAGVVAALPHCDDFLAGHSLATFADLTEVIARA